MFLSAFPSWALEKVKILAAKSYWPVALGLLFGLIIIINGISLIPYQIYQRLSENPFVTRYDIGVQNYWQESVLLPVVTYHFHWTTYRSFNFVCLVIIVASYALFSFLSYRKFGSIPVIIFSTLLFTNPLTTILLTWLGSPDPLSVLFTMPFLFFNSGVLMFGLSILGATNHIVVAIASVEILLLRWIAGDGIKIKHVLFSIAGSIFGIMFVKAFIAIHEIRISTRLDQIFLEEIHTWFELNSRNFSMTTFSFLNVQWLVLLTCVLMFFAEDRRYFVTVFMIMLLNYGVTFFTYDSTRVYILLTWGVVFHCIFHSFHLDQISPRASTYEKQFLQLSALVGILSIIFPRYYSWNGDIHSTPFYESLERLFRWLTN